MVRSTVSAAIGEIRQLLADVFACAEAEGVTLRIDGMEQLPYQVVELPVPVGRVRMTVTVLGCLPIGRQC